MLVVKINRPDRAAWAKSVTPKAKSNFAPSSGTIICFLEAVSLRFQKGRVPLHVQRCLFFKSSSRINIPLSSNQKSLFITKVALASL
mmetsp:Transcript_52289/g.52667  ORF Transcript_52289/g.52667 Transcript_52289/m.52667 type:complete len:87 (-) Transcript_52289:2239-2499(-)